MIAISRVEKFSTRLLALKKDILTLPSSTWRGQVSLKDREIPLFVLLPKNIVMPPKNLRLVVVLLSQFKMTEKITFHFFIWKVLWGHAGWNRNAGLGYDQKFYIEVEVISGKKFSQIFTVNNRQVVIVPGKYEHLFTYISTYLVWW